MQKKVISRLIAFVMAAFMVFSLLPVEALAAAPTEDYENEIIDENDALEETEEDASEQISEEAEAEISEEEISEEEAEEISEDISEEEISEEEISEEEAEEISEEDIIDDAEEEMEEDIEDDAQIGSNAPIYTEDGVLIDAAVAEDDVVGDGTTTDPATTLSDATLLYKGSFEGQSKDAILSKIKQIREEAYDNNYIDPDSKKPLKEQFPKKSDYVNIKWSKELEDVASTRAVEASLYRSHVRPNLGNTSSNGKIKLTCESKNHVKSVAENVAWNTTGLLAGIEQFYKEKDIYVNKGTGETGHYEAIISGKYHYYGVASFKSDASSKYPYCISLEAQTKKNMESYSDSYGDKILSEDKINYGTNGSLKSKIVPVDFDSSFVTSLSIDKKTASFTKVGTKCAIGCQATVEYEDPLVVSGVKENRKFTKYIVEGVKWTKEDESNTCFEWVNDKNGTINPKSTGSASVKVMFKKSKGKTITSKAVTVNVYSAIDNALTITSLPEKTTYVKGESLDVKGGVVNSLRLSEKENKENKAMKNYTIEGYSKDLPDGLNTLYVVSKSEYGTLDSEGNIVPFYEDKAPFDILMLNPVASAKYGQKIKDIELPQNEYGTYTWSTKVNLDLELNKVGPMTVYFDFTPKAEYKEKFSAKTSVKGVIDVYREISDKDINGNPSGLTVDFLENDFTYDGTAIEPKVVVAFPEAVLKYGKDYTLEYKDNVNAGTATVTIKGLAGKDKDPKNYKSYYWGSTKVCEFTIKKAQLTIKPNDIELITGEKIPETLSYEILPELYSDVKLTTEPYISIGIDDPNDTSVPGIYYIYASNAEAPENFEIAGYEQGKLRIVGERMSFDVTFDIQIPGYAGPNPYVGVPAGTTIDKPEDPVFAGKKFIGWYKEATLKTAWNFEKDTVKENTTLYAKWVDEYVTGFRLRTIEDSTYTGSKITPKVEVYDGEILLKKDKDYTVKYFNNVNANAAGKMAGSTFDSSLPYVQITGKGNYTDKVVLNFNILPTSIGNGKPAAGITAKYKTVFTKSGSAISPFTSLKYKKSLKKNKDFTVKLTTLNAVDASGKYVATGTELTGAKIPKNYTGSFTLKVEGLGNYSGNITEKVMVVAKANNLGNATITLGKNQKSFDFESGKAITLTPAYYDTKDKKFYAIKNSAPDTETTLKEDDCFTVKAGDDYLVYGKDYTVSYANNKASGKATMTITGRGDYCGSKSVNFTIKAITFGGKSYTITGISNKVYTGKAITQTDLKVVYKKGTTQENPLVAGVDYSVSYKNNIKKGTAEITLKGLSKAGYSGKITKKFKITAAPLTNEFMDASMANITVPYSKAGAKPVNAVILTYNGKKLVNKTDYTVSFSNYSAVAGYNATKAPTIKITGKGNFSGKLTCTYTITKQQLNADAISASSATVKIDTKKGADYAYKPSITVKDGAKKLAAKKDYTVEYVNNTQGKIAEYLTSFNEADRPKAIITATGKNYEGSVEISLPVYKTKLTSKNTILWVDATTYTGSQLTPQVHVFIAENNDAFKIGKKATSYAELQAVSGLIELPQAVDDWTLFTVTYGKNIAAGKNKGSVKVTGTSPFYTGSVSGKFTINKKGMALE